MNAGLFLNERLTDPTTTESTTLTAFDISFTDVDDERPYFTKDEVTQTIDDGTTAGATVYSVLVADVEDPDAVTGSLLYWLEGTVWIWLINPGTEKRLQGRY